MTQQGSAAAGLPAYEISNHAGPGAEAGTTWSIGAARNIRHRRRCTWPPGSGRPAACHRHGAAARALARAGAGRIGHGVVTDERLNSEERADEFLLMGLAARRRHRSEQRLSRRIDPAASLDRGAASTLSGARQGAVMRRIADGRRAGHAAKAGLSACSTRLVADLAGVKLQLAEPTRKLFGEPATGTCAPPVAHFA